MDRLHRLVLVRHGETTGNSSVRFYGRTDVPLSEEGRRHMRQAAYALRTEFFDAALASPLQRSFEAAWIVSGGGPVQLVDAFREVDFGRWEGLTAEEIQARDPELYARWQSGPDDFQYPEGEKRSEFRARVEAGLDAVVASGVASALAVVHKGVIRVIFEKLTGGALPADEPSVGGHVGLSRRSDGSWFVGRNVSDPTRV
jgi:broad specificity phosphatase PhoE